METSFIVAMIAATITVLANGLGAVPFLFIKHLPDSWTRAGWSLAGGLMLSASVFNLIFPGVEEGGFLPVAFGIFVGSGVMALTSKLLNGNEHAVSGLSVESSRKILLVLITMFIHSFPEGLAVGIAYGSGEAGLGLLMALAILIHNIPEGTAVAMPLRAEGVSGWKCIGWAIFSGLPQLLAAAPAYLAVVTFRQILPFGFGFAAGAMIFLVMSEMIPTSRMEENQRISSALFGTAGFLIMMLIQTILIPLVGLELDL
jgi:ZIP family zinc transporter